LKEYVDALEDVQIRNGLQAVMALSAIGNKHWQTTSLGVAQGFLTGQESFEVLGKGGVAVIAERVKQGASIA
jgi:hypothetical protein